MEMNETRKPVANIYGYQEIESFYRFVYENGLRKEAYMALKLIQRRLNLKRGKPSQE